MLPLSVLQFEEGSLVVAWNHFSTRETFDVLEALGTAEPEQIVSESSWGDLCVYFTVLHLPSRMVSCKPALRYAISPVLNDMAMITDEQESPTLRHVDLHAYEAIGVAR